MARPKPSNRERLLEATIATAARYGYREASVARVVAQAGVSRATFYACFEDRDDCFLAAYRTIAKRVWRHFDRVSAEPDRPGRLQEIVANLLDGADRHPVATRFFLIEAFAAGPAVRAEHERLLEAIEQEIDRRLCKMGGSEARIETPARVALGAVASLIAIRVFRGEFGNLAGLIDDLMAWFDSYAVPAAREHRSQVAWTELGKRFARAAGPAGEERRPLPRGRGALPPPIVASAHRNRILDAVGSLARQKGYLATTVADIVAAGGVTRAVFYEQFRSKHDAFLAAQGRGLEESVAQAAGEYFASGSWPDRVWNAGLAMLAYTAEHPDNAYVEVIESSTIGAAAIQRSFENRMAYTLFLEDGYRQRPEAEALPRLCSEAISGGLIELLRRQVVLGRAERVLELVPQGAYVTLAPFIGAAEAINFVEAKVAEAGGG